jgi:uncharacterized protein UPF0016
MEAFLVSIATVGIAEMGDRTQLLSLVLAAQYRQPWPILAGVLVATLANHAVAGLVGVWFGELLQPRLLDVVVGAGMLGMALWTLKPDAPGAVAALGRRGAFVAALIVFFIAEIGDKTQARHRRVGRRLRQSRPGGGGNDHRHAGGEYARRVLGARPSPTACRCGRSMSALPALSGLWASSSSPARCCTDGDPCRGIAASLP